MTGTVSEVTGGRYMGRISTHSDTTQAPGSLRGPAVSPAQMS